MKIAWITYDFEEYSILHANALAEEHQVMLLMPNSISEDYPISKQLELALFDKPRMRQPLRQWHSVRNLVRSIDSFSPDVVHLQQGHLWFNFAIPELRKKYPLVLTIHDPRHHAGDRDSQKTPQWVMDFGFRRANHVIVHGQSLAKDVERLFGHPAANIHVIPHVAMGLQIGAEVNAEPKITTAAPSNTVLFFGRIWDYKGLETLIMAEPLITAEIPDVKIVIAGAGDDFSKYERLMTHRDRFEIHHRWISDEERDCFFREAALVVLPYHEATQSGVVPVAYNHSKPVVATDVGALSECIIDQETGLLVPPKDPSALASAIINLLNDPERRRAMGQAGKRHLTERASPSRVAQATVQVYAAARGVHTCVE
ncbi:glycosyltransferase family 4 protein [Planctomycetaceae bacterium SH139]